MSDVPTREILGTTRGKQIVIDPELESLIPPLTADERDQLAASIEEYGQIDDVVLGLFIGSGDYDQQIVVDGHNRIRIMLEQGYSLDEMRFRTEPFHDRDEAMLWMLDHQFGRRNLTTNQKLELGYRRAELRKGVAESNRLRNLKQNQADATESANLHNRESVDITQDAADYAGVSRRTASKYHTVMENADPETLQQLQDNEISIDAAYKRVKGAGLHPEPADEDEAFGEWVDDSADSDSDDYAEIEFDPVAETPERLANRIESFFDQITDGLSSSVRRQVAADVLKKIRDRIRAFDQEATS